MSLLRRVPLKPISVAIFVIWTCIPSLTAQGEQARQVKDPPLLEIMRKALPKSNALMVAPNGQPVLTGEAALDLNVTYTNSKIWNPADQRYDQVKLRSYQGKGVDPDAPYVSPTIEIYPGETIRLTLNNQLPLDPGCTNRGGDINTPHCFNGTNLHTHGLWVNPGGNGDNVLISINPGVSFQYEIKVPPDHPAGTFWYHSHRHGSTALQVSSGMAGALIVRGTRLPTLNTIGDIDTLLQPTNNQAFTERVVVLQQIQYACRDAEGKIKTSQADKSYKCDPGDIGTIEGYDQFGPPTWRNSGRHTSINGQILPTFSGAKTGQIERWRLIHGGVRDTISLEFRKMKEGGRGPNGLKTFEQDKYIVENCTGDALPQHLIAADGLTLASALKTDVVVFQPAYRWDSLLVFPKPGVYCVINTAAPASGSVGRMASSRQLLGLVDVDQGGNITDDITNYLTTQLVMAAGANMPPSVSLKVASELQSGLKFASFVPHEDIKDNEISGTQTLVFNIDVNTNPLQFQVNGMPYDPTRIDRVLRLDGVDEWTLKSDFVSHPFHIHINPFQIVKILDPKGNDVSAADSVDSVDSPGGIPDPQYRGLKGVWKDTLWIKNLVPPGNAPGQYTLFVRTRYKRYIGDFVLHCHILDHEDQGMMQNIRIALPDGPERTSQGHH